MPEEGNTVDTKIPLGHYPFKGRLGVSTSQNKLDLGGV